MKKGDIVTIYTDPLTCKHVEGKARLIKDLTWNDEPLKRWTVKFLDTGDVVDRFIKK